MQWLSLCGSLGLIFAWGTMVFGQEGSPDDLRFFETRIRGILVEHCYECHSADSKILRGGLRLDHRAGLLTGGDSGPALQPGKPNESVLIAALKHESLAMPPKKKLPDEVIADFAMWIERGAFDPRVDAAPAKLAPVDWEVASRHWAFQTIADPQPPQVPPALWSEFGPDNPIDQFIGKRLADAGMSPAPRADKRTLIRRATYDLVGLPPTAEEVEAFLADDSPTAFANVVDRLLASPRYGERWGRHWLDLVRYADTNGADENHQMPNAWRYRDWVVRAFNRDQRLDEFITHQLAGDLLPTPTNGQDVDEQAAGDLLTATGMLVIGPKMLAEQDKDKMLIDIVDEQVDTVSRTFLGLTMGCARCHDHKFDPISSRDYYALAGIFYSTQTMADRAFVSNWMERPLPSAAIDAARSAFQPRLDEAKAELERLKQEHKDDKAEPVVKQKEVVKQLEDEMPKRNLAMAVAEAKPVDLRVHVRGNHLTLAADAVPRTMPTILTRALPAPTIGEGSGRRELAQWLVSPDNPLTARVLMNRVWMWHFGKPLMRSPSNFGLKGEAPTHPELLDWLARELMRRDWSLKEMHRLIVLSASWQMSSASRPEDEPRDPENRFLRRQNRRRLEAEPIRDAIFSVAGGLDLSIGEKTPHVDANRRAIYLPIDRAAFYEMFSTFDYVEAANHIEQRPATVVPQQALFLMNSPIVVGQSRALAETLLDGWSPGETEIGPRIDRLFQRLLSRAASAAEMERCRKFVSEAEQSLGDLDQNVRVREAWAALCRAIIASNEFLFVE